jgi:hypothetical protein
LRRFCPVPCSKGENVIRKCSSDDFEATYEITNDAAQAYKGVIPDDRWKDPYMTREHLRLPRDRR